VLCACLMLMENEGKMFHSTFKYCKFSTSSLLCRPPIFLLQISWSQFWIYINVCTKNVPRIWRSFQYSYEQYLRAYTMHQSLSDNRYCKLASKHSSQTHKNSIFVHHLEATCDWASTPTFRWCIAAWWNKQCNGRLVDDKAFLFIKTTARNTFRSLRLRFTLPRKSWDSNRQYHMSTSHLLPKVVDGSVSLSFIVW